MKTVHAVTVLYLHSLTRSFPDASLDGNVSIESEVSVSSNNSIKLNRIRPSNSLRCLLINARSLKEIKSSTCRLYF